MKFEHSFFFFVFFFLPTLIAAAAYDLEEEAATNPLIRETCRKVALNDSNVRYGFCAAALQSAPNSLCADSLRKLGFISVKLVRVNITSTRCYIKYLLRDKKVDPYVRSRLDDCLELYSDALPTVKQAVKDYQSKRYRDANVEVSSVIDAATTCEDGFEEKEGLVSPLKKRNDDVFKLSALALTIINMLPR
ncbi:hypothetical protein SAY87_027020 [Trapa incisa]|uniref:Pectinesterase inhibitor domain-containing protein n=1 Tax=Trapa incisa TaxID=236973 RepID=A0AAN7JEK4_9MYRT|nr:hypothetical protein SAY87_027020 [Trapa incisa]